MICRLQIGDTADYKSAPQSGLPDPCKKQCNAMCQKLRCAPRRQYLQPSCAGSFRGYTRRVSWKILVTASGLIQSGERAQQLLRKAGCELVFPTPPGPLQPDGLARWLPDIDATLAGLDDYAAGVLSSPTAAKLKIIARWGVGYDNVDLPAASRNGIVVTYTPGLLDEAVADYTFALLLSLARRIPEGHDAVRRGEWKRLPGSDVGGKTLGLVGCGRIGRAVARRAQGFNMRVLAYGPRPPAVHEVQDRFRRRQADPLAGVAAE